MDAPIVFEEIHKCGGDLIANVKKSTSKFNQQLIYLIYYDEGDSIVELVIGNDLNLRLSHLVV